MIGTLNVLTGYASGRVIPCERPDQVGQVLRVEPRQLQSGLLGEDVKQMLAGLVPQSAKSPQDVGNVLWLTLISLSRTVDTVSSSWKNHMHKNHKRTHM